MLKENGEPNRSSCELVWSYNYFTTTPHIPEMVGMVGIFSLHTPKYDHSGYSYMWAFIDGM